MNSTPYKPKTTINRNFSDSEQAEKFNYLNILDKLFVLFGTFRTQNSTKSSLKIFSDFSDLFGLGPVRKVFQTSRTFRFLSGPKSLTPITSYIYMKYSRKTFRG